MNRPVSNVTGCRLPRCGFSLIELLVSVAVLAVLASLLISGIGAVKKRSLLATGMSHHRQVTAAYLSYLSDNGGVLWYREASGAWSGGSGGLFGPQNYASAPGYLCYLLEPYGLARAEWNAWKDIPNRGQTVWYSPASLDNTAIKGHGATYFYSFLGKDKGDTITALDATQAAKPYMRDYFGSYESSDALYSGANKSPMIYAYLDGHLEYR